MTTFDVWMTYLCKHCHLHTDTEKARSWLKTFHKQPNYDLEIVRWTCRNVRGFDGIDVVVCFVTYIV